MTSSVSPDVSGRGKRPPKPSVLTKLAYGVGSVAYGVKNNGFDYFFLIFYSQVVGIDARYVGFALTIALIFDAVSDPIVGYWSDNFRSRWGRRHPFMYAAAVPVSVSYFFMWYPPTGWSDPVMFWYVLILAVFIRTFITFYETPSSALAPELTDDYDQRSSLISYRYYFGWTGGNTLTVIMFVLIFPAFTLPDGTSGQFSRDSYAVYGFIGSVLMFLAIMISALGTHSSIPHLITPPEVQRARRQSLWSVFGEIFGTLADRSFIALFAGAVFGAIATGLAGALSFFFYIYFWQFTSEQIGIITAGVFISAVIGSLMAPLVTRTMGKKRGAMSIGLIAFLGSPLPVVLRLFGLMPENGTDLLFLIVFLAVTLDVGLIICFQILFTSMIADLVEHRYLVTGRRSEGVLFAAVTFIRKVVQGLGVTAASLIIYFAAFPKGAAPDEVPPESIYNMGVYYVPTILTFWLLMMACVSAYKLNREQHEENLRKVAAMNDET